MNIVDSSGWSEYFADGPNADVFAPPIEDPPELLVPSVSLYEVFKRVLQQRDETEALKAVALMQQGRVVDLSVPLSLNAARISIKKSLPMADSIILAIARMYFAPDLGAHLLVVLCGHKARSCADAGLAESSFTHGPCLALCRHTRDGFKRDRHDGPVGSWANHLWQRPQPFARFLGLPPSNTPWNCGARHDRTVGTARRRSTLSPLCQTRRFATSDVVCEAVSQRKEK